MAADLTADLAADLAANWLKQLVLKLKLQLPVFELYATYKAKQPSKVKLLWNTPINVTVHTISRNTSLYEMLFVGV